LMGRLLHLVQRGRDWFTNVMAWHRHTSLTNFTIQHSRSFEGVPLRLTNCLFPVPDSQPTATELFQSPLYRSGTVFCSITFAPSLPIFCSRLKTYFFEFCYRNYCCGAREVTPSFMDTLIALTYLLIKSKESWLSWFEVCFTDVIDRTHAAFGDVKRHPQQA